MAGDSPVLAGILTSSALHAAHSQHLRETHEAGRHIRIRKPLGLGSNRSGSGIP